MPSPPSTAVPRGRVSERKGDQRLAALLEALEQLLAERPIADIGIGDITREAGISRPAFYFYFESKTAALATLVDQVREQMLAIPMVTDERTGDVAADVRRSIQIVTDTWLEHRHLCAAMIESASSDPAIRDAWATWMETFIGPTVEYIEGERAAGRAPDGPPAEDLARTLAWANERNFYRVLTPGPSEAEVDALVTSLSALWFGAIYGTAGA